MSAPSEDKAIMYERARLERFWATSVTPPEQTDWNVAWSTRPPTDAYGRTYLTFGRTSLQQTIRPPETIYAWSQIYATLRFGIAALTTPTGLPETTIATSWVAADATHITLSLTRSDMTATAWPALIYVSGCLTPSAGVTPKQSAFMCSTYLVGQPATINVSSYWLKRFRRTPGATIVAQAFSLTPDNGLTLQGNLATTTMS